MPRFVDELECLFDFCLDGRELLGLDKLAVPRKKLVWVPAQGRFSVRCFALGRSRILRQAEWVVLVRWEGDVGNADLAVLGLLEIPPLLLMLPDMPAPHRWSNGTQGGDMEKDGSCGALAMQWRLRGSCRAMAIATAS